MLPLFYLGSVNALANVSSSHPDFDMKRCVNMGNSLESPAEESWGGPLNVENFSKIKQAGFDTVRIPVRWSDYTGEGPDYKIDLAFMRTVENAVTEALSQNLNVILNIHHYEAIMDNPKAEYKKLVEMWRQIATRFRSRSDDLWFETLNEPNENLKGDLMRAAQTAAVLAIRESNPTRLIILGGEDWSSIRSLSSNISAPDKNIIYTYHYYDPFKFTHQKAPWLGDAMPKATRSWKAEDKALVDHDAKAARAFRDAVGSPVFVGEFGAYEKVKQKDRLAYAKDVRESFEANGLPWCLWSFSNTFALYDEKTLTWDDNMMAALGMEPQNQKAIKAKIVTQESANMTPESWGHSREYYAGKSNYLKDISVKAAVVNSGEQMHPPHKHAEEEFIMILEGQGTWTVGRKNSSASVGDMLYAEPDSLHGLRNTGANPLRVVSFKYNKK